MKRTNRQLISSIIVGFSSLLVMDFYISDFKISFAVVMFPVMLYIFNELNPITFSFTSGFFIVLFRIISYRLTYGIIPNILTVIPEILFYLIYSCMFYIVKKRTDNLSYGNIFLTSFIIDFSANLLEFYIRFGTELGHIDFEVVKVLFIIGLIRASIVWLTIVAYRYYTLLIVGEENEKRYHEILETISQFKTEIYWMNRNMDYIENVMSSAYQLFLDIDEGVEREVLSKNALEIATDIHEIEKEYELVIAGIEEILFDRLDEEGMYFSELIYILKSSLNRQINHSDKDIQINYHIKGDFYTKEHYYLISILRNIIMNGIEAIEDQGRIDIGFYRRAEEYIFTISDDGKGIKENELKNIFSPGFSKKINYDTGTINRGLGLALVKSIVEESFNGEIKVKSEYKKGSKFIISIPIVKLEGDINEDIYSR